jgi:NAD(P)-dependent dehydrogenase (short-subunit alcohol dehydrogenase family)
VFTLDTHGQAPKAYWGGYAVAKAALAALLAILADEWESRPGLRVSGVVPGPMDSPMRRQTHPAENPADQAAPESIVPLYLGLIGGWITGERGQVWDARAWLDQREQPRAGTPDHGPH